MYFFSLSCATELSSTKVVAGCAGSFDCFTVVCLALPGSGWAVKGCWCRVARSREPSRGRGKAPRVDGDAERVVTTTA